MAYDNQYEYHGGAICTVDIETIPINAEVARIDEEIQKRSAVINAETYSEEDRPAPKSYKKQDTIDAWRETDKTTWAEKQVERMMKLEVERAERVGELGLSARTGRILSCAVLTDTPETFWRDETARDRVCFYAKDEQEETGVVDSMLRQISGAALVVTYSGAFDLTFGVVRSHILRGQIKRTRDALVAKIPVGERIVLPDELTVPLALPNPFELGTLFQRYRHCPHFDVRMALSNWDMRATGKLDEWLAAFGLPGKAGMHGSEVYAAYLAGKHEDIITYNFGDVDGTRALARIIAPYHVQGLSQYYNVTRPR
jgi:hypothetical protein